MAIMMVGYCCSISNSNHGWQQMLPPSDFRVSSSFEDELGGHHPCGIKKTKLHRECTSARVISRGNDATRSQLQEEGKADEEGAEVAKESCRLQTSIIQDLNSMRRDERRRKRKAINNSKDYLHKSKREALWIEDFGFRGSAHNIRNHLQWNKLISEHTKCGQGKEALRIYNEMQEEGVIPNNYTFVAALKACSSTADLESARKIHSHLIQSTYQADIFATTTLVDIYAKYGSIIDAHYVFEKMVNRNVVSWNAMITGYARAGMGTLALELYARMQHEGFTPDNHTFVAALKACASLAGEEEAKVVDGQLLKLRCLEQGRAIHAEVVNKGFESDIFIASTLVDMYAKCGSMIDACHVFEKMAHRNEVSWNAMMMGYAQAGMGTLALELYAHMKNEGFRPNNHIFVAALKACASLAEDKEDKVVDGEFLKIRCLEHGRAIHAEILNRGFQSDIYIANTLVDMYAKCGSITDARCVFEKIIHRNVVLWNTMILAYAQTGMGAVALELYARMQHEGFTPDNRTCVAALKACATLAGQEEGKAVNGELLKTRCLEQGREIHAEVVNKGFESDIFIASTLVDMYAKCGSITDACCVFEKMGHRNVVSWNAMILGYAQAGMGMLALELYGQMQHEGFTPDTRTFVAILKACASLAGEEKGRMIDGEFFKIRCLEQGRAIHAEIVNRGFESDIFVSSMLVDMYAKCGSMVDACQVFEKMTHRDKVSWNAMIMGYAQTGWGMLALELYTRMQREGFAPDDYTFVAALKACASLAGKEEGKAVGYKILKKRCLEQGRAIHAEIVNRGFESDIFVASTLVDMYAKYGSMVDAYQVFEKMACRDEVSWNAMILGYAQTGMGAFALEMYTCMQHEGFRPNSWTFVAALKACASLAGQEEGKAADDDCLKIRCLEQGRLIHAEIVNRGLESDIYIANMLVDMYAKCGSIMDACWVFEKMAHRDEVSWNAMIMGYAQVGMGEAALEMYVRMQREGFIPNACTFVAALKACGGLASLETGKEIHAQIHRLGMHNEPIIASCIVDMYSKCGSIVDAKQFFDSLTVRDSVTWGALIEGYCSEGDSNSVFDLYKRMQQEGIDPEATTFVSVLTACSHNGLVERGQTYFQAMFLEDEISPSSKHHNCMVDLLGRANQLDEAITMVKKMPSKPDLVTWRVILGACRKWNHVSVGRKAFACAVMLDVKHAAAYTLMMNICASTGISEDF